MPLVESVIKHDASHIVRLEFIADFPINLTVI